MTKPDDIPQDVWQTAEACLKEMQIRHWKTGQPSAAHVVSRAIMAEREACAKLVEELLVYADTTSRADAVIAAAIRHRAEWHGGR